MSSEINRAYWTTFFNEFSKRNRTRPTRIEVFGEMGAQEVEHHLPLNGITVDETGSSACRIEILLGGVSPDDERHLTHVITRATNVFPKTNASGQDEALEIIDTEGDKTLLSFEFLPKLEA